MADMVRNVSWPFPGDSFPANLGAVVQRTVLDGIEPARVVVHADDGSWLVGDGINDPNESDASIATHINHAVARNSSLSELSTLLPGYMATRDSPGHPWTIEPHSWDDP